MKISNRVVGFVFGFIFLAVGIFLVIIFNSSFKDCTVPTTGTVIDFVSREVDDPETGSSITYAPVVEYWADNQKVKSTYSIGKGNPDYAVGDTVELKYDPDFPENFKIEGDNTFATIGYILIVLGGVILIWKSLPIIYYMVKSRQQK